MKWISVKQRLPDYYDYVLVYAKMPGTGEPCPIAIAYWVPSDKWEFIIELQEEALGVWSDMTYPISNETITHWMPLPELP